MTLWTTLLLGTTSLWDWPRVFTLLIQKLFWNRFQQIAQKRLLQSAGNLKREKVLQLRNYSTQKRKPDTTISVTSQDVFIIGVALEIKKDVPIVETVCYQGWLGPRTNPLNFRCTCSQNSPDEDVTLSYLRRTKGKTISSVTFEGVTSCSTATLQTGHAETLVKIRSFVLITKAVLECMVCKNLDL